MKTKKIIKKLKKKRFNYIEFGTLWIILATLVYLTS